MNRGVLLHLTSPLQSWGCAGTWSERDTHDHPTRSGLLGLVAAASGHPRGAPLDRFAALRFTIRIDQPGTRVADLHTVGGGYPQEYTPPKAGDGRPRSPSQGRGTIVTNRTYLSDAAFTVAITSHDDALTQKVHAWLHDPYWQPYLGRRSCPPAEPFLLGMDDDACQTLREFPLHCPKPPDDEPVPVEFVADADTTTHDVGPGHRLQTLPTAPVTFHPATPQYELHTTRRWTEHLPARLCRQRGTSYLDAATDAITIR